MWPLIQTSSPPRLKDHPINCVGEWYQWSPEFREILIRLGRLVSDAPPPQLTHLYEGKPYDYTYTVADKLSDEALHNEILHSAECLSQTKLTDRVMLLTKLIDEKVPSETIHYLFSYFQYCLGLIAGKPDAAMYAPLGDLSETGFPFHLHADLYLQKSLFVLFDNVPLDDSGQTLLFPTGEFLAIIRGLKTMPAEPKAFIERLLTREMDEDRFDDFYYFLYQKGVPWQEELSAALEAGQIIVKLERGEGYLIDDRRWLHGRTPPSGAVQVDRLHRLIFNFMEAR